MFSIPFSSPLYCLFCPVYENTILSANICNFLKKQTAKLRALKKSQRSSQRSNPRSSKKANLSQSRRERRSRIRTRLPKVRVKYLIPRLGQRTFTPRQKPDWKLVSRPVKGHQHVIPPHKSTDISRNLTNPPTNKLSSTLFSPFFLPTNGGLSHRSHSSHQPLFNVLTQFTNKP